MKTVITILIGSIGLALLWDYSLQVWAGVSLVAIFLALRIDNIRNSIENKWQSSNAKIPVFIRDLSDLPIDLYKERDVQWSSQSTSSLTTIATHHEGEMKSVQFTPMVDLVE